MEVPLYGDQKVRTAPLPNARLNAEASLEAFGGGAVAAGPARGVQGVAAEITDIASKERAKAVDTMTQEGFSKIVAEKNRLIYDPKEGVLQQKGKAAFAAPEQYGKQFDDFATKVEDEMPDVEARQIFRKMRLRERSELNGMLSRHVSQQAEQLQEDTFKGLVSTLTEDAVANFDQAPGKIGGNLRLLRAAADKYADDKGLTGEDAKPAREALWKQITSRLHVGVVNRMVAMDEFDAARSYFKANESGIDGMQMGDLERQIKKTDVLKQKDSYLAAASMLDKAGSDADPKAVVPGFDTLSPEQRAALGRRFSNEQSPTAHHEFYALSPDQVAGLDRAEFETKYWSRFDADHRRKAEVYWKASIDAQRGGKDEAFKSIRGDKDMITTALRKNKIVPASGDLKGVDAELAQRFEDYIDDRFKTFAHENKRNPKDEEKQKIIHRALLDKVYVSEWGADPQKPRGTLTDEEIKLAYVPLTSIKRSDRLMLVNLARAQGVIKGPEAGGPNDDRAIALLQSRIERAYAVAGTGKATRADLIASMKGD